MRTPMVVVGSVDQFTGLAATPIITTKKLANHIDDDDDNNNNMTRKQQPSRAKRTGRRTTAFLLLLLGLATMIRPTEAFFLTRIVVMVLASLSNLMGWSDSCPTVPTTVLPPVVEDGEPVDDGDGIVCTHEHAPVLCEFRCLYDNKCQAARAGYDGGCIG
jgi:hypothetical protein